jgi:hypothetical protein
VATDQAQATLIGDREQSDGWHEHLVQDGRYTGPGALDRAQAELQFAYPLQNFMWVTTDMQALPGRAQRIQFDDVNAALQIADLTIAIHSVELTFPIAKHPPFRTCTGSTSKIVRSMFDVMLTETG